MIIGAFVSSLISVVLGIVGAKIECDDEVCWVCLPRAHGPLQ